jgi:hypothetical protein
MVFLNFLTTNFPVHFQHAGDLSNISADHTGRAVFVMESTELKVCVLSLSPSIPRSNLSVAGLGHHWSVCGGVCRRGRPRQGCTCSFPHNRQHWGQVCWCFQSMLLDSLLSIRFSFFFFFCFSGLDVGSLPGRLASLRTASRSDFCFFLFLQSLTWRTYSTALAMVAHCGRRLSAQCTSFDLLLALSDFSWLWYTVGHHH